MMFFVVETKISIFAPTKLQNNEKTPSLCPHFGINATYRAANARRFLQYPIQKRE